jgi:hypothetical protein
MLGARPLLEAAQEPPIGLLVRGLEARMVVEHPCEAFHARGVELATIAIARSGRRELLVERHRLVGAEPTGAGL